MCLLFPGALLAEEVFVDIASESGIDFFHFNGMSGEIYFPEIVGTGSALLDYDRDGDLDIYIVQGTMLGPGKQVKDALVPPRHPLPSSAETCVLRQRIIGSRWNPSPATPHIWPCRGYLSYLANPTRQGYRLSCR